MTGGQLRGRTALLLEKRTHAGLEWTLDDDVSSNHAACRRP